MARVTRSKTKWMPVPEDPDGASIEFRLLKPGEEKRLGMIGVEISGTVPHEVDGEVETHFKTNLTKQGLAWMDRVFKSWEHFYDKKGKPAPCDKRYIAAMCDELEIPIVVDEETQMVSLYEWAVIEYDKYAEEEKANQEESEKN